MNLNAALGLIWQCTARNQNQERKQLNLKQVQNIKLLYENLIITSYTVVTTIQGNLHLCFLHPPHPYLGFDVGEQQHGAADLQQHVLTPQAARLLQELQPLHAVG